MFRRPPDGSRVCGSNGERSAACEVLEVAHVGRTLLSDAFDLLLTLEHGELANYYLAHSARADMYRRLGRTDEARASYKKALALTQQEPERQFPQDRIRQLK
jgi:predicted RNA polymerase sigma factor